MGDNLSSIDEMRTRESVSVYDRIRRCLLWFTASLVFSALVYGPLLSVPFAHHDQYRFFRNHSDETTFRANPGNDSQYVWLRTIGRPIAAELEYAIFRNVRKVGDLSGARFATIVLLAASLAALGGLLCRFGLRPPAAFALSAATFTLPGCQFAVFMASMNHPVAYLLALGAAALLQISIPAGSVGRCLSFGRHAAVVCLLVLAMASYPFSAFLFVVATAAMLCFDKSSAWPTKRNRAIRDISLITCASLLYVIVIPALFGAPHESAKHQLKPHWNVLTRLPVFAEMLRDQIATLWFVRPAWNIGDLFLCVIGIGGVLCIVRAWRSSDDAAVRSRAICEPLQHGLLILALVCVSSAPYLAAPTAFSQFRMHVAPGAIVVLLLGASAETVFSFATSKIEPEVWRRRVAFAIAFVAALVANHQVTRNAINAHDELTYLSARIGGQFQGPVRRIHIIQPVESGVGYNGGKYKRNGDEFNVNSLTHINYLECIVNAALLEINQGELPLHRVEHSSAAIEMVPRSQIAVTFSKHGEPIIRTKDMIFVDMNELMYATLPPRPPTNRRQLAHPRPIRLVETGYREYNILEMDGTYYGIRQAAGGFDTAGLYNLRGKDGTKAGDLATLKRRLDIHRLRYRTTVTAQPELVLADYAGYNILQLGRRYYAIRRGDGAFDLAKYQWGQYPNAVDGPNFDTLQRRLRKVTAAGEQRTTRR